MKVRWSVWVQDERWMEWLCEGKKRMKGQEGGRSRVFVVLELAKLSKHI